MPIYAGEVTTTYTPATADISTSNIRSGSDMTTETFTTVKR